MRWGTRIPPAGITKLSQLEIDADKDWNNKRISNVKSLSIHDAYPYARLEATVTGSYPRLYFKNPSKEYIIEIYNYDLIIYDNTEGAIRHKIVENGYFYWYDEAGNQLMYLNDAGDLYVKGSYYTFSPRLPSDPALLASLIEREAGKPLGERKDVAFTALGSGKLIAHLYRRVVELEEKVKKLEALLRARGP